MIINVMPQPIGNKKPIEKTKKQEKKTNLKKKIETEPKLDYGFEDLNLDKDLDLFKEEN